MVRGEARSRRRRVTPVEAGGPCELLEWDSEHFGFGVARVVGSALDEPTARLADEWCADHEVRCLYFLADADDAEVSRAAAESGFRVVDLRMTIRRSMADEPQPSGPDGVEMGEAREAELDSLRSIAAVSHRGGGRFYFDGGFPAERCDALYRAWIDRGFRDPDRMVLVSRVDGEPVAYQVVGPVEEGGVRRLELIAVDPRRHGAGLGGATLSGAVRLLRITGTSQTWTILSARNIATVRLHARHGFISESVGVWHHKWYGRG
jgi:GNAT superfamily N-acetyltransferase